MSAFGGEIIAEEKYEASSQMTIQTEAHEIPIWRWKKESKSKLYLEFIEANQDIMEIKPSTRLINQNLRQTEKVSKPINQESELYLD